MALDDQAMEFQIGMDIKDLLSRVDDLEGSFEDFVRAGEDAGDQAIDTSKSMDMMAASAEGAGIAVKALTISAVALGALGIGALLDGFTWLIKKGFEAQDMFRNLAVRTGMTIEEMDAYGDVVFESTQRYGLALREVNTIATFVATNSLRGRKNIEDWTDALASLQTFTKSNEETTKTFGELAINLYRLSGKEAKKFGFGLEAAWNTANITFEEGVGILKSLEEVTATVPGREKEMAMQIAVATAALRDQGFTTEESIGLVNTLFDRNSRLGAMFFKLARRDLPAAVGKSLEYMKSLGATGENLDIVAGGLEVTRVAFNKGMHATFDATKAQDGFNKTMKMTTDEIEENKKGMETLGDLWGRIWGKLGGILQEWGNRLAGWLDQWVRPLLKEIDRVSERFRDAKNWGDFVKIIKEEWKTFTDWWDRDVFPTVKEDWEDMKTWFKDTALPAVEDVFIAWVGPFSDKIGRMMWEGIKDWTGKGAMELVAGTVKAVTFGAVDPEEMVTSALRSAGLKLGPGGVVPIAPSVAAAPPGAVTPKIQVTNQVDNADVVKASEDTTRAVKDMHKTMKAGGAHIVRHQPVARRDPLMDGNT